MHILLILIITAMGALQFLDHHSLWGNNGLTLSSCEEEEHSHSNSVRDHVCLLLRRHQTEAILVSEQFTHRFNALSQSVYSENLILNDRFFASLFVERAPPA
ncbi:MAG: hypothetical protein IIB94_04870 [Candidatus Marinimicrobia bacterium]|nr:hypothetical protein [Candidatus Neomarinimicrobiota bacterium]